MQVEIYLSTTLEKTDTQVTINRQLILENYALYTPIFEYKVYLNFAFVVRSKYHVLSEIESFIVGE